MKIGYARVSTGSQHLDGQLDALNNAGCEKIFDDTTSSLLTTRPGLDKALELLRKDDVLVVTRLDRLGRSMKHLIQLVTDLNTNGVGFRSLGEGFDTTTNGGKLIFHVFGAMAEFERTLIVERVKTGLVAARARGRIGGRRAKLSKKQLDRMVELYDARNLTVVEICAQFGISRTGFYKMIAKHHKSKTLNIEETTNG